MNGREGSYITRIIYNGCSANENGYWN